MKFSSEVELGYTIFILNIYVCALKSVFKNCNLYFYDKSY